MKPRPISTNPDVFWKVGSTWTFGVRRGTTEIPVDITGQTPRAMFRANSLKSPSFLELTSLTGLSIPNPADGFVFFTLTPEQTVLFTPNVKTFFDLELTDAFGIIWQSPTFYLKAEQEVTRDV